MISRPNFGNEPGTSNRSHLNEGSGSDIRGVVSCEAKCCKWMNGLQSAKALCDAQDDFRTWPFKEKQLGWFYFSISLSSLSVWSDVFSHNKDYMCKPETAHSTTMSTTSIIPSSCGDKRNLFQAVRLTWHWIGCGCQQNTPTLQHRAQQLRGSVEMRKDVINLQGVTWSSKSISHLTTNTEEVFRSQMFDVRRGELNNTPRPASINLKRRILSRIKRLSEIKVQTDMGDCSAQPLTLYSMTVSAWAVDITLLFGWRCISKTLLQWAWMADERRLNLFMRNSASGTSNHRSCSRKLEADRTGGRLALIEHNNWYNTSWRARWSPDELGRWLPEEQEVWNQLRYKCIQEHIKTAEKDHKC